MFLPCISMSVEVFTLVVVFSGAVVVVQSEVPRVEMRTVMWRSCIGVLFGIWSSEKCESFVFLQNLLQLSTEDVKNPTVAFVHCLKRFFRRERETCFVHRGRWFEITFPASYNPKTSKVVTLPMFVHQLLQHGSQCVCFCRGERYGGSGRNYRLHMQPFVLGRMFWIL